MSGLAAVLWVVFYYAFAVSFLRDAFCRHTNESTIDERKGIETYAFISSLVFLTCYNVVLMGRTATWDVYCHSWMMGGIYCLWKGLYEDKHTYRWFSLAGVLMGLSFMSKGPVSFYALLLPFICCLLLYKRVSLHGKYGALSLMVLICLVISSWWYVYLLLVHPEAINYVIHKESSSWLNHSTRPWWYYWRFFAETGIWAPFMLMAYAVPYWNRVLNRNREYLFMITWVFISLVLMSCMPEKKYRYILPLMVPCCYTITFILCFWRRWAFRMVYIVTAIFAAVELFGIPFIASKILSDGHESIAMTRQVKALDNVPYYHDAQSELRIEIVYAAGRKIRPLDLRSVSSVRRALPCAILTHERVGTVLSSQVLALVDTVYCGHYNDAYFRNYKQEYINDFSYHVTLLKRK
jgi:4-amino-4-deoxy-L-arabinose transferase-like glycosyltransferase